MRELIERLEKADGPSRGLDGRIAWALGWRFNGVDINDDDFDEWDTIGGHWHKPGEDFCPVNRSFDERLWPNPPEYTASVDAAIELADRVLPDRPIAITDNHSGMRVGIVGPKSGGYLIFTDSTFGVHPDRAIALCIAILKAKEASS